MSKRLSDDEKRVFTDRIVELEAEVAGMQDKWTPPDEMAVHQNHMSLLKNENERLTKLLEEPDELKAYIKQALPFLEEAWIACFHGQKQALLSAEERGMGQLLVHFRAIAEGEYPLPPGVITTREASEQTESAIRYWTELLGDPNEPVPWLQRWVSPGQTAAHALRKANEHVEELEEENTLLAEHNRALRKIEQAAKLYLEHGEPELADELEALLTGGE